ncbi:MAG TPA: acetyl-CoA carboxylase biotin carboxyl carrier protein [Pyrinomonadaceae bacterium]|jgi:acetyl-CoA carboxylase biotin carboxyl carrier protein|nr:acetyl-CoA carboxylase biotin carboxyl carrier protein [Pyrinomonadaceae bacterium]
MSEQDKSEPTGVAPAREPRREGAGEQSEAQRGQSPVQGRGDQGRGDQSRGERRGPRRHNRGREGQPQSSYGRPEESLNMDELRELFGLFTSQGFTEFELEKEGFRVRLRRDLAPPPPHAQGSQPPVHTPPFAPQQPPPPAPAESRAATNQGAPVKSAAAAKEEADAASDAELFTLTSPIVGTFYRASSPNAEPFVKVGSPVGAETVVCIIEAMKLMNEILAETTGVVEKIYVENGQPVEFGQPLFGIRR